MDTMDTKVNNSNNEAITKGEIECLPDALLQGLANCSAILVDEVEGIDFELYLEGKDENIFVERLEKTGLNGNTRLRLFAVETGEEERKKMNFPKFKSARHLADYLPALDICNLSANKYAKEKMHNK